MPENTSPDVIGTDPPPPARRVDPLAAALGNASLLGVGYVLLRRWARAIVAIVGGLGLVALVTVFGQPGWSWRGALTAWWVVVVADGVLQARASAQSEPGIGWTRGSWGQRVIAGVVAAVMGLAVTGAVLDARRVQASAADAHTAGDCHGAVAALRGIAFWHEAVDPFVDRRAAREVAVCGLLDNALAEQDPGRAAELLSQYLADESALWAGAPERLLDLRIMDARQAVDAGLERGDADELASGFATLSEVLAAARDRAGEVAQILSDYRERLPQAQPCRAKANVDWFRDREPTGDQVDELASDVDELAPAILLACGDALLPTDGHGALDAYQALLERYPDDDLAEQARTGVTNAETAIEGERVRTLLANHSYCTTPAPYRAAPAYAGGPKPHLVLSEGSPEFTDDVPAQWRAGDYSNATLVLCVTGPTEGDTLRNCNYEGGYRVSLKAPRYAVKVYELRTGTVVVDTTVNLASTGCPSVLRWQCTYTNPNCPPPPTVMGTQSDSAVGNTIRPWVNH